MFVDFKSLPENAKVWIYPSSRKFYSNEIIEVEKKLENFINNWKSSDEIFKASYQFLHNRFLILAVDDSCSSLTNSEIDTSISFILKLQEEYNIHLLDRMNVCFKQGKYIQYKELKDFKKLLRNKAITGKTIIFDNLITTKYDFEHYWEIPIEDSWYKRFL